MVRVSPLFETTLIRIERIDHPADARHVDPDEEESQQYSVNLLERGTFSICERSRFSRVTAADAFLTAPGRVYRYVHDEHDTAPTDVCIAVCIRDAGRDEVQGLIGSLEGCPAVVPPTNRRAYVRSRLFEHLATGADSLALDVIAAELIAAAVDPRDGHRYKPDQLSWYGRRVDAVRRWLDEEFASDHSLTQLARSAGMSPFHFARVFRELTGVPPHRYLLRRRLAAAVDRLREGESVTDTCFAVGFHSLSHFIHAFSRQYGVSPSRIRRSHRAASEEHR